MALHRSYARDFGIGEEELVAERKAPTCQAYTDFLMRTAAVEPFEAIIAALLPCFWGYYEMGKSLEERGFPDNELYVRWIEQYTDPGYGEEVRKCRELTDRLGKEASASTASPDGRGLRDQQPLRIPILGDVLQHGEMAGVSYGASAVGRVRTMGVYQ